MPLTKPTSKVLNRTRDLLSYKKQYRDRLLILKKGRDTEFWKALKIHLELILKGSEGFIFKTLEADMSSPSDIEVSSMKLRAGSRQVAIELLGEVEQTEEYLNKATEEIKLLEDKVKSMELQRESGLLEDGE